MNLLANSSIVGNRKAAVSCSIVIAMLTKNNVWILQLLFLSAILLLFLHNQNWLMSSTIVIGNRGAIGGQLQISFVIVALPRIMLLKLKESRISLLLRPKLIA